MANPLPFDVAELAPICKVLGDPVNLDIVARLATGPSTTEGMLDIPTSNACGEQPCETCRGRVADALGELAEARLVNCVEGGWWHLDRDRVTKVASALTAIIRKPVVALGVAQAAPTK